ncbi:MAG: sulfatase-like hydrolase/transferase [Bacteroidota bacterium]
MKQKLVISLFSFPLVMIFSMQLLAASMSDLAAAQEKATQEMIDRTALPIVGPVNPTITELDARNVTAPARFEVKAPKGAPNVVIILIDDMGFGQTSTFGGPIPMPTLDRLASEGLRYNQFHTAALCSPTRMAILTGRNHHSTNTGAIMELATAFEGNTGVRPLNITPLAEILRQNGYSTAAFGKYHETPPWEVSVSGPYDRWPTHSGFDKFYGFIGGETNQWAPLLWDGTTMVEPPKDPNYHFTVDMTNQAIAWVRSQHAMTPDRPFFIYFATGATHAPHHVPKEWIAKFKGKFDEGWDKYREETLARQIKLGIVPAGTKLAPKPNAIKDWDKLTPDEKKLFAHQMEVFAGFAAQTDHEIGRLTDTLQEMGVADNTLIFYMVGDNGASAEGGMMGVFNEFTYFNGVAETVETQLKHMDELGGPKTFNHYAAGWAVAGDTPFEWTKQVAGSYGGTQNPLVISWPARINAKGELRTQFQYVTDIAPTILEAVGIPEPKMVNGVAQRPMEGVSMMYTFDNAQVKSRHTTQYFEIAGNRGIYHDGWLAGTVHKAPWELVPRHPLDKDVWELYNTADDFSLANDLAAKYPEKLKEMETLFMTEAVKYHVLPIDDRTLERFDAARAGRPDLMGGRSTLTVYPGMHGMMENAFINVKNRSNEITAELEIPAGGTEGVILAQGGRFGGWSLYVKDNHPMFAYNWLGLEMYTVRSATPLPVGKVTVRYVFAYDGGKPGSGGTESIFINGKKVAEGRIGKTQPNAFSADDGADVGLDEGTNVTDDYKQWDNRFTGTIQKVTIKTGDVKLTPAELEKLREENVNTDLSIE